MDLQWTSIARTGSSSSRPIFDEGGVELIGSHRDIASLAVALRALSLSLSSTMQCRGPNAMASKCLKRPGPGSLSSRRLRGFSQRPRRSSLTRRARSWNRSTCISVWAAGLPRPRNFVRPTGLETTCNNQLVVLRTLQTTLGERVLIVGDCCFLQLHDFRKTVVNTLTPLCCHIIVLLFSGRSTRTWPG